MCLLSCYMLCWLITSHIGACDNKSTIIMQFSNPGINTAFVELIMFMYFKLCQQGVDSTQGIGFRLHFVVLLCKYPIKCLSVNVGKGLLMASAPLCQSSFPVFNIHHDFWGCFANLMSHLCSCLCSCDLVASKLKASFLWNYVHTAWFCSTNLRPVPMFNSVL